MPLFNFKCNSCGKEIRKILKSKEVEQFIGTKCPDCTGSFERAPTGPTTQVMERLDNGVSPRAVERLSEAERLFKERANKYK